MSSQLYDYIIVGSGLFGSVFAHEMTKVGKKCLVIEKREHPGGNIYTEKVNGINVHKYGAHIFHTNDEDVWDYINQFASFNNYVNSPIAIYKNELYNLPFNMNTFSKLWGVKTPQEAKEVINQQIEASGIKEPRNLEEQAISMVGTDIYEKLIKGYTKKQWGRDPVDLPSFIIKRLPLRFTYDNNYFNDKYQGIPEGGYSKIIDKLLENVEVKLNTDFLDNKESYERMAAKIVYTGPIDELFGYHYGKLEYRGLRFETTLQNIENYQGCAVVNYTEESVPYTRIIEHKHFEFTKTEQTIITKEFPSEWKLGDERYYPVNDEQNQELYNKYRKMAKSNEKYILGGRLAEYKYYDMHVVIRSALNSVRKELEFE
ncbi:UDP-galactopyranose mutase [Pseudoalteromonas peptidolytica]|uniref:UDP-galactopyranose mutase n=1 Tax=Pseudoalteromonas peptidolytica F12-50-A1 TaxID=1315280 RepID=A0A8I0T5E7_9GAMM|nr:UDP-galactopyranose mutase [Pseudoalteromonas peptidolytica]MBE0347312.1 UDP-galactopyranose mutase [Pseudoalteromonas peptidolytica F12-50-A1]NLR13945.1 UDP-galactopyranose mutase [Pseudoalteromonas peptidolytica]GEK09923.1 UDP-galactopyranose mutase [Pseudoalteromonas peptidolytica]